MGNSFRPQPGPAIYGENKTPFRNDLVEVGIFVAFAMIAFSFVLIIPGIRGWEVSTENIMRSKYNFYFAKIDSLLHIKFLPTICSDYGPPFEYSWRYG